MIAGQLMFQTTSAATSAVVPRLTKVNSWVKTNIRATASRSSGTTNEKIITKLRPEEVRVLQRSIPIAKPTPIGTVMTVVNNDSLSVWITAWWSCGSCHTELMGSVTYQRHEKPCHALCDLPLLNENSTAIPIGRIDHAM